MIRRTEGISIHLLTVPAVDQDLRSWMPCRMTEYERAWESFQCVKSVNGNIRMQRQEDLMPSRFAVMNVDRRCICLVDRNGEQMRFVTQER